MITMITTRKIFAPAGTVLAMFATFVMAQSPESIETKRFSDKGLGGECILISAKLSVDGQTITKTFEIEVPESGKYYMNAWAMGVNTQKGIQSLMVYVDSQDYAIGNLEMSGTGWQCAKLVSRTDKTLLQLLSFDAGMHTISFQSEVPYTPAVEFIRLAKNMANALISDLRYRRYIDSLKALTLPANYEQLKKDSTSLKLLRVLPNPQGDYVHNIDMGFTYTYYNLFYFYAGAQVVFETKKDDPYASDPVMEFFNSEDPINKGSWVDDNGGEGYQAKISCTVQYTGYYYLRCRIFWQGTSGTSDLYLYDNLYASDIPLAGYGWRCDHSSTEQLNYFTCYLTGDSRLWIEDQSEFPGKIRAYNDDYYGSGDFYWGLNSRVKKAFSMPIRSALISAYSSNNPTGTCDLYMKCGNSDIMPYFENLKADAAIRSAPASGVYNCISWSGAVISQWCWPPSPYSPWYDPNPLTAFDKFYGNNPARPVYNPPPWNYTRSGATSGNATIDLWALNGDYTHASIRKPGNDMPHGYDCESKPGSLERTFHPRDALRGSAYGNISQYYRSTGTYAMVRMPLAEKTDNGMTLDKSVAAGLSIMEEVELSASEKAWLDSLLEKLPQQVRQEFDTRYSAWKETWNDPKICIHADPRRYAQSKQYEEFLDYCKKQGKAIWPLLFHYLAQGDFFVINALEDLTFAEYRPLLDEIRQESAKERYTAEGVYIAPSIRANAMKYIKKLLALPPETWGQLPESPKEQLGKTSTTPPERFALEQNYPNPFNPLTQIRYGLPAEKRLSLKIHDILGKEIAVLVDNENKPAGWHTATWNGEDRYGNAVASGLYFCRLIVGTNVQTIKLVLMR